MQACLRDTLIIYAVRIVSFVLFKMARGFAENVYESLRETRNSENVFAIILLCASEGNENLF